jgi:beta-galactosidase GanA
MTRFDGTTFLVDEVPYLVVGAELHNSSASSLPAIDRSFTRTAELGATTILAPVAWEQWEPSEGSYDTTLIDAMLYG